MKILAIALALGAFALLPACTSTPTPPRYEPGKIDVRGEMLTVTPATGPLFHVLAHNPGPRDFAGAVSVRFPDGWKVNKTTQELRLDGGASKRVAFAIERGLNSPTNSYPVQIDVRSADGSAAASIQQSIVCASAPYLDAKIDGQIDDWKDAIPAMFTTEGRKTIIRTAWTKRAFSLLVAVEEGEYRPMSPAAVDGFDAVQIAIAPRDTATPGKPGKKAERFEFLLTGVKDGATRCVPLCRFDEPIANPLTPRPIGDASVSGAEIRVFRKDGWTYYECSIPFSALAGIEPDPGREFCFSLLVHDPDGTGLRDWGSAAGLWPTQRTRFAWTNWAGSRWPANMPFDNKIEWGFCSSAQ